MASFIDEAPSKPTKPIFNSGARNLNENKFWLGKRGAGTTTILLKMIEAA